MQNLNTVLRAIPAPDTDAMARAQQHIDGLLKPPGSLGRLEALAVQLAGMPRPGRQPPGGGRGPPPPVGPLMTHWVPPNAPATERSIGSST